MAPDGLPRVNAQTDLVVTLIDTLARLHAPDGTQGLQDGDIVVISSKVVAKSEGRIASDSDRAQLIVEQTQDVIAEKNETKIVRNKHGLILAAAGIDASNTEVGTVVLLPSDPDESAMRIRRKLEDQTGLKIGVIVSDTLGRPWRLGLTDAAIGSAGVVVLEDLRGRVDPYGRGLELTQIALGDELAAAADLVKSKTAQRPVAVVRGLGHLVGDHTRQDAKTLVRPAVDDLFTLGTREAERKGATESVQMRRTVREFDQGPLGQDELAQILTKAVAAAVTAPAPHHTRPWRFVFINTETKPKLLAAMESRWRQDLAEIDACDEVTIEKRIARGRVLHLAPALVVPCITRADAHDYPDFRRAEAERDLFTLSGGAAIENFLIFLATQGWGSAWVSSSIFCADDVVETLEIPSDWQPLGVIAVGKPALKPKNRESLDVQDFITWR